MLTYGTTSYVDTWHSYDIDTLHLYDTDTYHPYDADTWHLSNATHGTLNFWHVTNFFK